MHTTHTHTKNLQVTPPQISVASSASDGTYNHTTYAAIVYIVYDTSGP